MSDEHTPATLLQLLSRWPHEEPLTDSTRVRLICHQPQNGVFAYLHRLYPGLPEQGIAGIEAIVGHSIPPRLRRFYMMTNGSRLFEGQVSVSGLVSDFSRDPSRQFPISIEQTNLAFAIMRSEWHRMGFFRVGTIAFLRQNELVCGPNDQIVVLHGSTGQPLRDYSDIFACLDSFIVEMGQFWTDGGIFTGDWKAIDHLLLGVSGTA